MVVTSDWWSRSPWRRVRLLRERRWMPARARTVPPRPTTISPRAAGGRSAMSCVRISRRSARSSRDVGGSWRTKRRVVRTAPSDRLAIETTLRRRTRLSWRLAPPMSTTRPLLNARLSRAASTPSRASSRALKTCTSMPSSRRSGSSSRSRFSASRTADVATATMRGPRPFGEYRAKKRCTVRSVASIASRGRVPGAPPPSRVGTRSSASTR